ncbi:MAG: FtsX-like permease family protein [Candidatus Caldatribacterium sp.]|nr:FtsX-like permease family protein [Candidatus Caldatribacterium sp.]
MSTCCLGSHRVGHSTIPVSLRYSQGAILGLFGSSLGALAGFFLIRFLQQAARASGGAISFSVTVNPSNILFIVTITTVASLLAAISPARQAVKLLPIEVIRNG